MFFLRFYHKKNQWNDILKSVRNRLILRLSAQQREFSLNDGNIFTVFVRKLMKLATQRRGSFEYTGVHEKEKVKNRTHEQTTQSNADETSRG